MNAASDKPNGIWRLLTWPNRISLARLLLIAPYVILLEAHHEQGSYRLIALGLFILAAASDAVDGYLARHYGMRSKLGGILDPLADKALVMTSAILLTLPSTAVEGARLPTWVVVMIVGKDLWVIVGFLLIFLITGQTYVRPGLPGKLTTFAQAIMIPAILLSPELNQLADWRPGYWLARGLWWAVAVFCVLSVLSYTRKGIAFTTEHETAEQKQQGD
jgi:cardiolipin synthase